jgi:hypothetical protein
VINLLADVNIEGHVRRIVSLMQSEFWREFWEYLDIRLVAFHDVGLSRNDADSDIWRACQQHQLYLLTDNRNDDGPESLEATMRKHNSVSSLPVFTLGDADRVLQSHGYAERVVESLYDKLLSIDSLRGTGRLFLPRFSGELLSVLQDVAKTLVACPRERGNATQQQSSNC